MSDKSISEDCTTILNLNVSPTSIASSLLETCVSKYVFKIVAVKLSVSALTLSFDTVAFILTVLFSLADAVVSNQISFDMLDCTSTSPNSITITFPSSVSSYVTFSEVL